MQILSITVLKTCPFRKRFRSHCVGDELFGWIDPGHLYAGPSFRDLKGKGPYSGSDVEHSSCFRNSGEIHDERSQDPTPTAHESDISFGVTEHHGSCTL